MWKSWQALKIGIVWSRLGRKHAKWYTTVYSLRISVLRLLWLGSAGKGADPNFAPLSQLTIWSDLLLFLSFRPYLTWKKWMSVWLYNSFLLTSVGSRQRNASFMFFSSSWETLLSGIFWLFSGILYHKGPDVQRVKISSFALGLDLLWNENIFGGQCINISAQFLISLTCILLAIKAHV